MRRGNPRPSIAIDHRAQRPFESQISFPLNNSIIHETAVRVYDSPRIETHGYTAPQAFVSLGIKWQGIFPPAFGLIGYLVMGLGTTGSPGPPAALSTGIPGLPGKAVPVPGVYALPVLTSGDGIRRRHVHGDSAWFELWAVGRGPDLEVAIDGMLVSGWSYS